jgi:hypothetical protein
MEQVNFFLSNFCLTYQTEVIEFLNKCHAYIKDLLSFKKITIYNKLEQHTDFQKQETIQKIITSTNSALNTIGIPLEELVPTEFIFEKVFSERLNSYKDYNEFYEKELKEYVNRYLFVSLIEYIIKVDENKLENLDLFDLLPPKFKKKLIHYRNHNPISLEEKQVLLDVLEQINHYVDLRSITIILGSFNNAPEVQIPPEQEEDIMDQLKNARESILSLIETPNENDREKKRLQQDLEDLTGAMRELDESGTTFAHSFGNFSPLRQDLVKDLDINIQNLNACIAENPEFLDLENLFYLISIVRLIGTDIPLSAQKIEEYLKLFVNTRVFSSGIYHKPNPISNAYGLSILSELNIIDNTDIVDLLDIEMFLENEFISFIPEKLILNFYTLIALKLLEKKGNIIRDKNNLLKELISMDVTTFPDKSIPLDILCHLATIKLIQESRDITRLKNIYYSELKNALKDDGSVNHNLTDSARGLLILKLLDLDNSNDELIRTLVNYIISHSRFFIENPPDNAFNWQNDQLAFKVELRMLFWVCLALYQIEDFS